MTHNERHTINAARLTEVWPGLHAKLKAIIADMEKHGFEPIIDAQVWRSPAEQRTLVAKGVSAVEFGFHNCTTSNGKPDSLAVDLVHFPDQWNAPVEYWLMLASSARAHGLETGILWGLSTTQRARINLAIRRKQWRAPIELGWDAAHIQPRTISIADARAGFRPKF